ncbi:MAG TPA: sigma 54-interacting transcriptional regulator [Longimicrobium sp.]|uniref:sigma 54-interacting transcriptional regulator n=1 Tax=Longimicrobium sp. TaxID=2029185 RepID=UPI002ED78355
MQTAVSLTAPDSSLMLDSAVDLYRHSLDEWGEKKATVLIGRHPLLAEAIAKTVRFAGAESPVLITGETGTGKELFARAVFLNARRHRRCFLSVNCAQYVGTELIASELFGHRKGSFTGAVTEHRGIFEEADGGFVFLDEIGDLPMQAQAMLLRALGEGEIVPVGSNQVKRVDVRVVAATSRDLQPMIAAGKFRADLYYRLRPLHVQVPALRDRSDDWELIARHYLDRLSRQARTPKDLSAAARAALRTHRWPGNVREVKSVVETGFHIADGCQIAPADFAGALDMSAREQQELNNARSIGEICARMSAGQVSFWDEVHRPFIERDLNRDEVRQIIAMGLESSRGSYKRLLSTFGVGQEEYLKFMDFLRHHRLKPELQA